MVIKQLKYKTFAYDEVKKEFSIIDPVVKGINNYQNLNKVYAFAFVRFVLRIAQKGFKKRGGKS
jgi:hypothetical protein